MFARRGRCRWRLCRRGQDAGGWTRRGLAGNGLPHGGGRRLRGGGRSRRGERLGIVRRASDRRRGGGLGDLHFGGGGSRRLSGGALVSRRLLDCRLSRSCRGRGRSRFNFAIAALSVGHLPNTSQGHPSEKQPHRVLSPSRVRRRRPARPILRPPLQVDSRGGGLGKRSEVGNRN